MTSPQKPHIKYGFLMINERGEVTAEIKTVNGSTSWDFFNSRFRPRRIILIGLTSLNIWGESDAE